MKVAEHSTERLSRGRDWPIARRQRPAFSVSLDLRRRKERHADLNRKRFLMNVLVGEPVRQLDSLLEMSFLLLCYCFAPPFS